MVDFTSQRYMLGNEANWSARFNREDQQAHQAWAQNEERRRYDESTRLAREGANLERQLQQQQAGLFNESELANLTPGGAPSGGPMQLTPSAGGGAGLQAPTAAPAQAAPTRTPTPNTSAPQTPVVLQGHTRAFTATELQSNPDMLRRVREGVDNGTLSVTQGSDRDGNTTYTVRNATGTSRTSIHQSQMSQREAVAWQRFVRAQTRYQNGTQGRPGENITNDEYNAARAELRNSGLNYDVATGNIYRLRPDTLSTAVLPDASQQAGLSPEVTQRAIGPGLAATGSAVTTGLSNGSTQPTVPMGQTFEGITDTTRPLQPTREMRMASAAIESDRARAELYARHGRPDLAQEAFARSLQGQANLLTAERQVLYRAAANGSFGAMQRLMEVYNGYPRGTVRMSPVGTNNSMINVEYQMQDGSWVSHGAPLTRDQVLGGLLNLVDAEGSAARSEANQEYMRTVLEVQGRERVARIGAEVDVMQMLSDNQRAQLDSDTRLAIASGRADVTLNEETGELLVGRTVYRNGRPEYQLDSFTIEDQRSPDTNGRETQQVRVGRRVTGVNNVGAN